MLGEVVILAIADIALAGCVALLIKWLWKGGGRMWIALLASLVTISSVYLIALAMIDWHGESIAGKLKASLSDTNTVWALAGAVAIAFAGALLILRATHRISLYRDTVDKPE